MTKKYISVSNALEAAKAFHEQLDTTDSKRYPEKALEGYRKYKQLLNEEKTQEDWEKVYQTLFGRKDKAVNERQAFTLMIMHCGYAQYYLQIEVKEWLVTLFKMRCHQDKEYDCSEWIPYPNESALWKKLSESFPKLIVDRSPNDELFSINQTRASIDDFSDFIREKQKHFLTKKGVEGFETCASFIVDPGEMDIMLQVYHLFIGDLDQTYEELYESVENLEYSDPFFNNYILTFSEIYTYMICAFGYYTYHYGYDASEFFELLFRMIYHPENYKEAFSRWYGEESN